MLFEIVQNHIYFYLFYSGRRRLFPGSKRPKTLKTLNNHKTRRHNRFKTCFGGSRIITFWFQKPGSPGQPSRPCRPCHVDYFSRVSYARFGRVADEHWFFVSCLNIATGAGPFRVRPRHSCFDNSYLIYIRA